MARKALIFFILILCLASYAIAGDIKTYHDGSWQTIQQKAYKNGAWQLIGTSSILGDNLLWMDYFDADLSAWSENIGTGGTIAINSDIANFAPTMMLQSTTTEYPAIEKSFYLTGNWIIEFDCYYSGTGKAEILDAEDNVICLLSFAGNSISFSTDLSSTPVSGTMTASRGYQIILSFDFVDATLSCYKTDYTTTNYPAKQIGTAKSMSTSGLYKLRYTTSVGSTLNKCYIQECRVYTPQMMSIGDSISQGIFLWENAPDGFTDRTDHTAPFQYQLSQMYNDCWIGNRGFGGSTLSEIVAQLPDLLEQNPTKIFLSAGHNDIMRGVSLASMESNFNSCISAIQAAGITGHDIIIGNCVATYYLDTPTEWAKRNDYNAFLLQRSQEEGFLLLDQYTLLVNPDNANATNFTLCANDFTHPNLAGYTVLANGLYNLLEGN